MNNDNLCNTDKEIISFLTTTGGSEFGSIYKHCNISKSGLRRGLIRLTKKNYIDYRRNGRKYIYSIKSDRQEEIPNLESNEQVLEKALHIITKLFYEMQAEVRNITVRNSMLEKFVSGLEAKHIDANGVREDERRKIFTKISEISKVPINQIYEMYK